MTEIALIELLLWIVAVVWTSAILIPLVRKVWAKYVYWYAKNFNRRAACPKCGKVDVMYNSDFCSDCYWAALNEAVVESRKKKGE